MPKKYCRSCLHLGKGISLIALAFSGSGEIPFPDILCPKNISLVASQKICPYLVSNLTFKFCLRLA